MSHSWYRRGLCPSFFGRIGAAVFISAIAAGLLPNKSNAANIIWTNTVTSATNWLATTNWNPNQVPGASDNAQFANAPTTAQTNSIDMAAVGGLYEVGAIEVTSARSTPMTIRNASATTVGTLQIDQTGGGTFAIRSASPSSLVFTNGATKALNISFNTTSSAVIDCANGSGIVIACPITSAPFGITKIGSTGLTLSGASTFTGKTVISNGTVNINSDSSLGVPPVSFVADQLQLSGGLLAASASFTLHANRGITLNSSTAINVIGTGNDFVIAGVITGPGGMTKQTANTTNTLTGANTFTGNYFVSQGTLRLGNKTAAGLGSITLLGDIGASADLTGANAITNSVTILSSAVRIPPGWSPMELAGPIALGGTTIFTNGSDTIFSGVIDGPGDLIRQGTTGVFTIKGTNAYANTYFCAGTNVLAGNDNPLPQTSLSIGTNTSSARLVLGDASAAINQTVTDLQTFGTGTANTIVGGNSAISTLTVKPNGLKTFAGAIGGGGANENNIALTINSPGHGIILSGANTYRGDTTIAAGKVQVGNNAALPNGATAGSMIVNASASTEGLDLAGFSPTVNGLSGSGNVFASTGTSTLTVGANNASSAFSGIIQNGSGTVALAKTGSGTLTLTGANTYSGGTTINGGVLQGDTTSLQRNIANNASLVFDQASSGTYSAVISGSGSVTKQNSGKLIFSGTSTYTGSTTVSGGTLQVDGSIAGSSVTVASTTVLAGNGTVGPVTINSGGCINAGASPGTLTTGAETWNSGGTNLWEVNDFNGTAGGNPGWDVINAASLNIASTSGSPFVIKLVSLSGASAGNAANFNNATDYDRVIVHTTGGISGNGIVALQIDASAFSNPLAASGYFSLSISGNDLVLSYRRAPVISAQPVSVTKQYGDTADFTVGATGSTLNYQWRKDGGNIAGATSSVYHIGSAISTDAGTYSCVVSNAGGTLTSAGATLTYDSQLPSVTTHPQPATQTVVAGATVSYSAAANSALALSVQWTHDGANISGETNATLTLSNVQVTDAGSYRAVFTNPDGTVTSDAAVLNVTPTVVYVNGSFANPVIGQDPDGAGPATKFGADSFATIQEGVNALQAGGVANIAAGTFTANVVVPRANIELSGAGQGVTIVHPQNSATEPCTNAALCTSIAGILVQGTNVIIHDVTIDGNNSATTNSVGLAVDGSVSNASVSVANCAITNNQFGVYASGALAKVKVQSCDLRGNNTAAIYAEAGALVDAGNCGADFTGLGASSGGNNLSGSAKAAVNASATIVAQKNSFAATTSSADISGALTGTVDATQTPLVASDLPTVAIECLSALPPAATNLSQLIGQGGAVSATTVTVTSTDSTWVYDGVITRTYTLIDACGQSTEAHQTINIHDAHAPTITTCPADRTLTVDAGCGVTVPNLVPEVSVTDNCDSSLVSISQSPAAGSLVSIGTTQVTITATDKGNNSATCTVALTVRDITAPVLSGIPADVTVECSSIPTPVSPTATDNCDTNPAITFGQTFTSGAHAGQFVIVRTWTATDATGNSSSGSQTITGTDSTAPVLSGVPEDVTVQCDAIPSPASPTASDACDPNPNVVLDESTTRTPSGCGHANYVITRTWIATDASGNSSTKAQAITVQDTTAPVLSDVPVDVTVECGSVPTATTPTATDNCDTNPIVSISEISTQADSGCPHANYTITRTWTATDICGNSSSATQVITVHDTTAPVLAGVPPDLTVACSAIPSAASPTASDNCDSNPTVTLAENSTQTGSGCGNQNYTLTRTWTATDACGNTSTAAQVITVRSSAPTITAFPADVTFSCANAVPSADDGLVSGIDACGGAVVVSHSADVISGMTCANRYTITRTYTVTGSCGDVASQSQTITVLDTTPPLIATFPADATFDCDCLVPSPDDNAVSATDGCGGAVTISHAADVTTNIVDTRHYQIVRTYTATDACGNSVSRDQVFTMVVAGAPTLTFSGSTDVRVTNANYTVSGTAIGDRPITSVYYSVNQGPFLLATGTANWQANIALTPGTNTVATYAVDNLTNSSAVSNAIVFYVVTNKLTVLVTDWPAKAKSNSGLFAPTLNGQSLEIGRNYTITASPGIPLHRFVGWATSTNLAVPVYATNATLTFMMQSGLTLVARFENPFYHFKGTWLGLFSETEIDPRSAGLISLNIPTLTDQGANKLSGKLLVHGSKYPFTSSTAIFDSAGHSHFTVAGTPALNVDLYLDFANNSTTLTGQVSTVDWTASLTAYRNLTNHTPLVAARYTAVLPPQTGPTAQPNGWGFAAFNQGAGGTVTVSGAVSDNFTISQSAKLSQDFKFPLYVPLYKNANGLLWGWLQFTNGQPGVSGTVYWSHPAGVTNGGFTDGFSNTVSIIGSPYTSTASPLLNWPANGAVLAYDGVHRGVTNKVQLSGNLVSVVTTDPNYPATNHLALTIVKGSGLISGSFLNPTRRRTDSIKGVLLQNQATAAGFSSGTNVGAYLMQSE